MNNPLGALESPRLVEVQASLRQALGIVMLNSRPFTD